MPKISDDTDIFLDGIMNGENIDLELVSEEPSS